MSVMVTTADGTKASAESILEPWDKRKQAALKARRPFEGQWMTNQSFAAGKQWVVYSPRDHRVLVDPRRKSANRSMPVNDVLTQYLWTAIGKFSKDDFRPQLLFQHGDAEGEEYTSQANKLFGWGWDEEWRGDQVLLDMLHTLVVLGTGAIRCRYDRSAGNLLGEVPLAPTSGHQFTDPESGEQHYTEPGKPITHPAAARDYVSSAKYYGEDFKLTPLREGCVKWELLSPWNLLPPPAVENERDFPWELIVRPVHVDTLKQIYGPAAADVSADEIEAMSILGLRDISTSPEASGDSPGTGRAKLEDHALVYTGYKRPDVEHPRGQTIVFTHSNQLLDVKDQMPYNAPPHGPRSGITYFRYWKVKQRFFGRALIEPGIGPQRTLNKRSAQNDEIIDRALPKVYVQEGSIVEVPSGAPLEMIEMKAGDPRPVIDPGTGPGPWMQADIELQWQNIERALGLHGVSLGQANAASAPYARIALESENDADKLDPIAKDFKLGVADVSRDSLEAMAQWPDGKQLLIAGSEDRLEEVVFSRSMVPTTFMVRPAKDSALPRSQAAEIQKIVDLWNAAVQAGVVARDPSAWIDWYQQSLDSGKAEPLPDNDMPSQQRHKAALENIVMSRTGQVLPVAPFDDDMIHAQEHAEEQIKLSAAAAEGDQQAAILAQVIEQHKQMHSQQMQLKTAQASVQASPSPGLVAPPITGQPQPLAPPQAA